jgi:hypothetical protein
MLTARAATIASVASEIVASSIMAIRAFVVMGDMSVGLNVETKSCRRSSH